MDPQYAKIEPVSYTMEARAPGVRWVVRNGERVLQEYWSIKSYTGDSCIGLHGKWRDVQIEIE